MQSAFDDLVKAIRSPRMLDNLGITIKMSELPSADLWAAIYELRFGSGHLNRFYVRNIRPFIAPRKHEQVCMAWSQARFIRQQEVLNAILEKGGDLDAIQ
jgi:hypothetical protein